ncbi:alkaline phosphatase family protein [Sphingomonas fuzhouensis]|uniref:alkaline phosphatase family protein n=1 Tax=Sphingomonas fuzhouensis TaxID=3106033 RepID=UPI002AFF1A8C|nr:ectonucleotide pyrophosphatase/phosphodiesterase [Sphingomonas sp. SGZ-02]
MIRLPFVALALALIGGCAYPHTPPALSPVTSAPVASTVSEARAPVTILVSIDGFRADYLQRGIAPNLSRLAADGVHAAMRPSFPSKTFPNHWTLVTGLVPDHHGIVANSFTDPTRPGERFTMSSDQPYWWNAAEPIWVTAEKAGIPTATMFWPGSNVAWGGTVQNDAHHSVTGGIRPRDWQQFNQSVSDRQRVDAILDWLRRPATNRPRFLTLYFDEVDTAGHEDGPDSPQVNAAVARVDQAIGRLVEGLAELHQPANLVIVADHGMAGISSDRVVALDRFVNPADYVLVEDGPYATFRAVPGHEADLESHLLGHHDHMDCWRSNAMPARFRYGHNPRIPPYFCLADAGWTIMAKPPEKAYTGGTHGYDNADPTMAALFIANGPAFRPGVTLAPFDNTDIAPLLRDLIGLPPGQGLDGNDAPFRRVLKR